MLKSKLYSSLLLLTVFAFGSGINISSQLSAFVLIALVFSIMNLSIISFSRTKVTLPSFEKPNLFVILFLIIVFYTMLVRGIGFEMLGSGKSGGMFYVKLITILLFYLSAIKLKTDTIFIRNVFILLSTAFVLPFLSDIIFLIFGNTWFNLVVSGSSTIKFYAESDTMLRIQSAAPLAEYLIMLIMVFFPIFSETGKVQLNSVNGMLLLLALLLIGISGHRMTIIGIALYVLLFYIFSFGNKKVIKPVIAGSFVVLLLCTLIILEFNHLPAGFQRTFSFLPFTPSNDVTADASSSLNFRLLMAAKAYTMFPDYYLLGKGFAFVNRPVEFTDFFGTIDLFADIGAFHNGLLGLVINLGLPGLITGMAILFSLHKLPFSSVKIYSAGLTGRILLALKCKIVVEIIYFIFLYGDVHTNFIDLIMLGAIYKLVVYHLKHNIKTAPTI